MSEREAAGPLNGSGERDQINRWRNEFPYHWDADEQVSRRELLQFVVYASGALFVGTAVLAVMARFRRKPPAAVLPIARAEEVPAGSAVYFQYPGPEDQAMLLHLPDGRFVAYSQKCTHLSCAVYYQSERGRLFCPCHDGVYDPESGAPIAGPPQRRLPRIALRQESGRIYAVSETP